MELVSSRCSLWTSTVVTSVDDLYAITLNIFEILYLSIRIFLEFQIVSSCVSDLSCGLIGRGIGTFVID
jgi:hypothetical protein